MSSSNFDTHIQPVKYQPAMDNRMSPGGNSVADTPVPTDEKLETETTESTRVTIPQMECFTARCGADCAETCQERFSGRKDPHGRKMTCMIR